MKQVKFVHRSSRPKDSSNVKMRWVGVPKSIFSVIAFFSNYEFAVELCFYQMNWCILSLATDAMQYLNRQILYFDIAFLCDPSIDWVGNVHFASCVSLHQINVLCCLRRPNSLIHQPMRGLPVCLFPPSVPPPPSPPQWTSDICLGQLVALHPTCGYKTPHCRPF